MEQKSFRFCFLAAVAAYLGTYCWLREEKLEIMPPQIFSTFNGKNLFPEFENDPEIDLTKSDLKKICKETKETAEKWFAGKDDDWLKSIYYV